MSHDEIVTQLAQITENPSEVIYSVTMQHILHQIVQRMGTDALSLSADDLHLLKDEIKEAMQHSMDYRDAVDEGIESFTLIRHL